MLFIEKNKQDIFSNAVIQVDKQGMCSVGVSYCKYRGANNCMCAIGASIEDEAYLPKMEEMDLNKVLDLSNRYYNHFNPVNTSGDFYLFLVDLQCLHDRCSENLSGFDFRVKWREYSAEFAARYDLKMPELPENCR